MYQYSGPSRPKRPKTPKLVYISLIAVLVISASVIVNYIYNEFSYRHGDGHSAAYSPDTYEPYIPMPLPLPAPAPVLIEAPATDDYEPELTQELELTPTPPPRVQRQEFLSYRNQYNNDDIIGHLWIPNTTIDYLVTQTTDNDFYLSHDIRGFRSAPGWVFLCWMANIHGQDQNLVVYGHNTARNHMFHAVRHFLDYDFFRNNRYIYFSTIYADYVFEVFSVYITHIRFMYILPNYDAMDGGWESWINQFAAMSHHDAGIAVSADDRVITLSTCDNAHIDYRIAVHARLISETFPHLEDMYLNGEPSYDA